MTGGRYKKCLDNEPTPVTIKVAIKPTDINGVDIALLDRFVASGVPTELGFSCAHRGQKVLHGPRDDFIGEATRKVLPAVRGRNRGTENEAQNILQVYASIPPRIP